MSKRKLPMPEVVAQLYLDGLDLPAIAKRYGATVAAVSASFKRSGLPMVKRCMQCPKTFVVNGSGGIGFCSNDCRIAYRADYKKSQDRSLPESIVYAVHFPSVGKLKIGFASNRSYVSSARARARAAFSATDGKSIWTMPGDYRHESFVQAALSFRYGQPDFANRRISEWFEVGDGTEDELVKELDSIFGTILDLTLAA